MSKNVMLKKMLLTGLTAAMVLGGTTSAFADGNHHDRDEDSHVSYKGDHNDGFKGDIKIDIKMNFDDVSGGDVDWAIKDIASLATRHVFEGYEDGTFKPRQLVSRVEAITAAVRLMGLRDKAESAAEMSTQLNFRDANEVANKYPWAVGYVAVAAENNLFQENETAVQPQKPADRLWATILLVKALKLDSEAQAKMNAHLSFEDAKEIPAGAVGYVAVAVEKGLIDGYDNNTFRPNAPITRAQLAALLDRTGNQLPDETATTGKVTVAAANNVLTIDSKGQTQQVTLDPNAFIYRNGQRITAADLKVGDQVRIRTYNNVALFVEVLKDSDLQQNFTVDGLFQSLTLDSQGQMNQVTVSQTVYGQNNTQSVQTSVYNVSPNLVILGNPTLLVPNHAVQLQGKGQTVSQITVK